LRAIAMATTVAVTAAGCSLLNGDSGSDQPVAGSTLEKSSITIGILNALDYAPVEIAKAKGYFRDEGLNVTIRIFPAGPATLPALQSGSLDVTLVNYVTFFQAVTGSNPQNLKIIADAFQADDQAIVLLAKDGSGISQPKDLVGKTVSVHQRNSVADLLLKALLHDNGIDPSAVNRAEVKFPDQLVALSNNEIAAGVELEPYIRQGENKYGLTPLVPGPLTLVTGQTANLPLSGYIVTGAFAEKNPRTVAAVQRAMRKAQRLATADHSQVIAVLPDLTGIDRATAQQVHIGKDAYPESLDPTRLQSVVQLMNDYGGFSQGGHVDVDASKFIVPTPKS
jgi:NitT/TauT family transport system substrate-binding protein